MKCAKFFFFKLERIFDVFYCWYFAVESRRNDVQTMILEMLLYISATQTTFLARLMS